MKHRCLIVDHDDTTVNSTATIHFPCFVEYVKTYFPHYSCDLPHYILKNFDPGIVPFFMEEVGMTREQMLHEQEYWNAYVQNHIPEAFKGIRELLERQRMEGGKICVVSHSYAQNIMRDFETNGLPQPDLIFGWEYPPQQRKPNPYPLDTIMKTWDLEPQDLLMVDDLKPGYDMAKSRNVPFAAAGWAYDIPEIEAFMRSSCDVYCKTVDDLFNYQFN